MELTGKVEELMDEWYDLGFRAGTSDHDLRSDFKNLVEEIVRYDLPVGPIKVSYALSVIEAALEYLEEASRYYRSHYDKFMEKDADSVYPDDENAAFNLYLELKGMFLNGFLDGMAKSGMDLEEYVDELVRKIY